MGINEIVIECIQHHGEGGKNFFDALDGKIRTDVILLQRLIGLLYNDMIAVDDYNIIVSGRFGRVFANWYGAEFNLPVIVVEGNLRNGKIPELIENIPSGDYLFLDDSLFKGRTRDAISIALKKYGLNIYKTYVVYDGSWKENQDVKSLYRYRDYFDKNGEQINEVPKDRHSLETRERRTQER